MSEPAPDVGAKSSRELWRAKRHAAKNVVIALALAAAGGLIVVRRLVPLLVDRASYTDGEHVYESERAEGLRYAVWDSPERLGGEVNGPERESRPALSPDGRWLVFAVGEEGLNAELYLAEVTGGEPRDARPIASLNTPADELAPAFGEQALYFASNRSGGAGGYDLYKAAWDGAGFGPAEPLAGGVNTPSDELDPAPNAALAAPGLEAVAFASDRAAGGRAGFDLYLALPAEPDVADASARIDALESVNSPASEREPGFTADGRALYFASDREPSRGGFDLYRSLLEAGDWLPPLPVRGLNSAGSERSPAPSADGFALYLEVEPVGATTSADEPAQKSDLFRARSLELFRRPPPPLGWYDLALFAALLLLALLAWLAKRWQALDILYKCFLVSLLVHLLLMWLFQRVHPDTDVPGEGGRRDAAFRVRLASERRSTAATRERGGSLEVARAQAAESAPERVEVQVSDEAVQGPSEPEAARSLARSQTDAGPAPERASAPVERSLATEIARAPELSDADAALARLAAEAPSFEVALREDSGGPRPARTGDGAATPSRATVAPADSAAAASLQPGGSRVALSRRAPDVSRASTTFEPAAGDPERGAALATGSVALAAPREQFERRGTGAGEQATQDAALPDARAFAPVRDGIAAGSEAGPERASVPSGAPRASDTGAASRGLARRDPQVLGAGEGESTYSPDAASPSKRAPASGPGVELAAPREEFAQRAEEEAARSGGGGGDELPSALAFTPSRRESPAAGGAGPERTSFESARAIDAPAASAVALEAPSSRPLPIGTSDRDRALPDAPSRLQDTPYRSRFGTEKQVALETHGGSAETERAVALGLAYLARVQRTEGYWGDPEDFHSKYRHALVGKTGLALLAFLGAGHTQGSRTAHSDNVARAIDFLLAVQEDASGHFGNAEAYSHGIATYALAENFALTKDERLREPLERALAQILRHQIDRGDARLDGGWSYYYPDGSVFDRYPRVSITSWQIMALESARLGGLAVPDETFEAARSFLIGSWDPRLRAFRYSHDPERLGSAYATLPGSTPAGMFALSLLGEDLRAQRYELARDYVARRTPREFRSRGEDEFVRSASGNLYFWYYGSLAMFRVGGDAWERWNAGLKETLLPAQQEDGSWPAIDVYAEYAGDDMLDLSYTTAMCVLTLEVYYRYFTPLLQVR